MTVLFVVSSQFIDPKNGDALSKSFKEQMSKIDGASYKEVSVSSIEELITVKGLLLKDLSAEQLKITSEYEVGLYSSYALAEFEKAKFPSAWLSGNNKDYEGLYSNASGEIHYFESSDENYFVIRSSIKIEGLYNIFITVEIKKDRTQVLENIITDLFSGQLPENIKVGDFIFQVSNNEGKSKNVSRQELSEKLSNQIKNDLKDANKIEKSILMALADFIKDNENMLIIFNNSKGFIGLDNIISSIKQGRMLPSKELTERMDIHAFNIKRSSKKSTEKTQ